MSINSNWTSSTEARIVLVRSVRMRTCTDDGSVLWSCGRSCLMRSTTAMMFAPGCRWMLTTMARDSSTSSCLPHIFDVVAHSGNVSQANRAALFRYATIRPA